MPRISILIACQAILCLLETYLISRISLIGKVGIALFYKEYKLLRSGWKTFLLFFAIQLIVIFLLRVMQKKASVKRTLYTASVFIIIALLGLWLTYNDFQHTYSHRLLKERFHLGFYIFWLGWIGSCVYFIVTTTNRDRTNTGLAVAERAEQLPPDRSTRQIDL